MKRESRDHNKDTKLKKKGKKNTDESRLAEKNM